MFDFVRRHNKILMIVTFVLGIPSFILFGIDGYSRMQDRSPPVARVNGRDISQQEWDLAHKADVERIRNAMPQIDAKLLDSPMARQGSLERLVRDRVLSVAAADMHVMASEGRIKTAISDNRELDMFFDAEGKFNAELFKRATGKTADEYKLGMASEYARQQMLQSVNASALSTASQADVSLGAYYERREVRLERFSASDYVARITLSDEDLSNFHKQRAHLFQAPEQSDIEYVLLDLAALQKDLVVSEADLEKYFKENQDRFSTGEERRASHILIGAAKTATPAERAKAKAQATELLAQLRKTPANFADLAKKHSQDPGSGQAGGDLGFFARGAMVKPFSDVAFQLKKGELSDVVETEYGYHIIMVTDQKGKAPTLAEVRPQIEAELKKQQAQRKFAEVAEQFSNSVYEQPDSLKPVADKLKLELRTANQVGRQPVPGAKGPLANDKFLAALFASDSVQKKRNTEAVDIGANQLVSGRIVKHTPARTRALEEVKDQVKAQLLAERSAEMARKEGAEKLAQYKTEASKAKLGPPQAVSREQAAGDVPAQALEAALRADPTKLPAWLGVDLGANGYAVVQVLKLLERPAPNQDVTKRERERYNQWWGQAEALAYYDLLKKRYKAEIFPQKAKPADGQ